MKTIKQLHALLARKKQQVTTRRYKFNQLSETIQQKIINRFLENLEFYDNFVIEEITDILEMLGFYNVKIHYSGFYSQGYGLSFSADFEYKKGMLANITANYPEFLADTRILKTIYAKSFYTLRGTVANYHSGFRISIDSNNSQLDDELKEVIYSLCHDFYIMLQNEYEYQTSEKVIIETIECNDYLFDKKGNIY